MWESYTPRPVVTTVALHGLCNRLRGIATGLFLARALDHGFTVYWGTNREMPAHFLDLFENPGLAFLETLPTGRPGYTTGWPNGGGPWLHLRAPHYGGVSPWAEGTIELVLVPPEPFTLVSYLNLKPPGMTDEEYMRQKHAFLTSLHPVSHIQADIDAVTSSFGPHTVGVHLRRTDTGYHWEGNGHPALQLYFSQMDACLQQDPDTMFFVSSDAKSALVAAEERYGRRAIWASQQLGRELGERSDIQGQADAVVDLFCLARTDLLIGTSRSTFSYEAAALGDIPLIEIAGKSKELPFQMPGSIVVTELDEPRPRNKEAPC